ncbi:MULTISPECIES: NAD(P) transhydrogenase subunit alpha [Thalassobaculum]|uniref:proton-translocating NAD(P)(+) transhydrogenase n=1 Tax=Thalassobaculum litoreum DSM 18839 TaxID=1123362 RepID=A0A8G2BKV5_9PROT|nr:MULTISPECIES: NAD(P) transhydrogenase subunit alpha [Thalassobaculum]SDF95314.1 NAD(P) transhydrogenase subunit alpha [Thalassobaculum litoreum DSM 18839]
MSDTSIADKLKDLAEEARELASDAADLATQAGTAALDKTVAATAPVGTVAQGGGLDPTVVGLTVFVLACFVGYYVVWRVTPALHSPLMAVTNAISSVIIVGALIAAGPDSMNFSSIMGFLAVVLASVNIAGGFLVTERMLAMFKKKK